VPGVFAVKYYRRPNFDVHLSGVENEITGGQKLELAVSGQYFFGKPVNGGTVKTVLVGERDWQSIASRSTKLDSAGNAKFTMKIPRRIAGGDYRVVFSLRDESGRTATHTIPCQVNTNNESSSWSKLPQFLPVDQPLALSSNRDTIEVTRRDDGDEESRSIPVRKQVATIAFEKPGWSSRMESNGPWSMPTEKNIRSFETPVEFRDYWRKAPSQRSCRVGSILVTTSSSRMTTADGRGDQVTICGSCLIADK
jgi:hypothetical protein